MGKLHIFFMLSAHPHLGPSMKEEAHIKKGGSMLIIKACMYQTAKASTVCTGRQAEGREDAQRAAGANEALGPASARLCTGSKLCTYLSLVS
jgi:hypothetical protein